HLELYARLIERHPESFARHLPALWARRQQDLGRCRRDLDALDHEWDEWLAARLDDRRSEVARLPPRAGDPQPPEGRAEVAAARERIAALEAERAAAQALAEERARSVDALERSLEAVSLAREREVAALRASWSWRLTRPLRAVVGALRGE